MSGDSSDIPDANVCEELCNQFAALTNTDVCFAQYYLQRRQWNLNRAVGDYLDGVQLTSSSSDSDDEQESVMAVMASPAFKNNSSAASRTSLTIVEEMKFITWNIDGLEKRSLQNRTENIALILRSELPDVVHLQELVFETYSILEKALPEYKMILGGSPGFDDYFTATLLRKATVTYDTHEIMPFSSSTMGRNLLIVKVKVNDCYFTFMNTHLESTKPYEIERKKQLTTAFQKMLSIEADSGGVILAGDLNLRDTELGAVGGIPTGLEDVWITCGSRPECIYTWDPVRNNNIEIAYPNRARFRFDRVYLRRGNLLKIVPNYFGLIGLEKIKSCGRFPSDHWGLISRYTIKSCK